MKVTSKNDTKKRKRDNSTDAVSESPKKAKVHAQRKFAQGAAYNSSPITVIKDKVRPPSNVSAPGLVLSAKRPNTEDFLTFLCFRRTSILPPKLDFFKDAFKQQQEHPIQSNSVQKGTNSSPGSRNHTAESNSKSVSRKNDRNETQKKSQIPIQALRQKYQEQRLAKQNPTNVTKLAMKVKGKNMIRTRSSSIKEEIPKPDKRLTRVSSSKATMSGLRSGLQRSPPAPSNYIKKRKNIIEMKNLRSRFRGKVVNDNKIPKQVQVRKISKNSSRDVPKKSESTKNARSPTTCGKMKDVKVNVKKVEGLSDFSSDDNEPLLAVRKGKQMLKSDKLTNGVKEFPRQNFLKTRSQASGIVSTTVRVPVRPTRKTKEAAAIYMEMITKKLVSPEKSGDDDRSSVDSFPELPNAKRNEQRETEIKAKAMALKRGGTKEATVGSNTRDRSSRSISALNKRKDSDKYGGDFKIEMTKKNLRETSMKKTVKEESGKKVIKEPPKRNSKIPAAKRFIKVYLPKKISKDEPLKKIVKDEVKMKPEKEEKKLRREESYKNEVEDFPNKIRKETTQRAKSEEIPKKIMKAETSEKVACDNLTKKYAGDTGRQVSKEETPKPGPKENPSKKCDMSKKSIKEDNSRTQSHEDLPKKLKEESNKVSSCDDLTKKITPEESSKKGSIHDLVKKIVREEKKVLCEDLTKKSIDDSANILTKEETQKYIHTAMRVEVSEKSQTEENHRESFEGGHQTNEAAESRIKEEETRTTAPNKTGNEVPKKIPQDESSTVNEEIRDSPNKYTVKEEATSKYQNNKDVPSGEKIDEEPIEIYLEEGLDDSTKVVRPVKEDPTKDDFLKKKRKDEGGKKDPNDEPKKPRLVSQNPPGTYVEDEPKDGNHRARQKSEDQQGKITGEKDLSPKRTSIHPFKEAEAPGKVRNNVQQILTEDESELKDTIKNCRQKLEKGDGEDASPKIIPKNSSKEEVYRLDGEPGNSKEEQEIRCVKTKEQDGKTKKANDRTSGVKKLNTIPKKGGGASISGASHSWLPPSGSGSNLVEAPTFHPTEKEFQDPLEFFEKIRPAAESFGLCRIVPPSTFKPDCKVTDDMRFTAYNQYVHRMFHRWGPNIKEMMAIKKYLATQSISLKQPPWIGGIEVDLPRLYQSVQNCGGLMKVMEKKKWNQVADMMKIPKAAQDRVTKLDDIYCKYLLPYDTLSHDERQKLFDEVESDWLKRQETTNESTDEESEEEFYIDECEECIVKGRNMALNQFFRIARNTMSMWFKSQEPSPADVENEFWRHVSERNNHVCVHSGSIDSSGWGYGFPVAKNNTFSRHPWNLKVLTNNSGSVLRSLGPVMGVTVPTLHVGMVFTAFCWYRDPHGLPWVEYLHTGAPKIWYGISDDNSTVFKEALTKLLPRYIKNKKIWLPSDTAMVPPVQLVDQGVSMCHTIQKPGQFILVFPRAFTSSICTGYLVSESVYFAQPSWLTTAEQVFGDIQDCCEPTMFSLEKLLLSIANDSRSNVEVLKQVLPMVWHIKQNEIDGRKTLFNLGLKITERLPVRDQSGNKKKKGRWVQDEEGDYECDICRKNLCVSLVVNTQEEGALCLPHAIESLTHKRNQLKHYKLMYTYTQEELCELVEKLEQRIESKSQKKTSNKSVTNSK